MKIVQNFNKIWNLLLKYEVAICFIEIIVTDTDTSIYLKLYKIRAFPAFFSSDITQQYIYFFIWNSPWYVIFLCIYVAFGLSINNRGPKSEPCGTTVRRTGIKHFW